METYSADDVPVNGEIKVELNVPECVSEVISPAIVVEPTADSSALNVTCRRSGRAARKRSLLLPGELDEGAVSRVSGYRRILPQSQRAGDEVVDGKEHSDNVSISRVIEVKPYVKPEMLAPRKKRSYRRRKVPEPMRARVEVDDESTGTDEVTTSRVIDRKASVPPTTKKRTYGRRKPNVEKSAPADAGDLSHESIDNLL